MVDNFRRQHKNMIALAEDILVAVKIGDAAKLGRVRLDFARATSEHFAEEGVAVSKAVADGLLSRAAVAERRAVVMRWKAEVTLCNSDWPGKRILETPEAFIRRFRPLIDGLRREAEIEEREIFAALAV